MLGLLDYSHRRLLIVDPVSDCEPLIQQLQRERWLVERGDLSNKIEPGYDVCIICLQPHHLTQLERIKQLIHHSRSEWIAVMSDDLRHTAGLANFIYEWFFDFHTLPIDVARLHCTLGRAFGMGRLRHPDTKPGAIDDVLMVGQSPST